MDDTELVITDCTDDFALAQMGHLLLVNWRSAITDTACDRLRLVSHQIVQRHSKIANLTLIEAGSSTPNASQRRHLTRSLDMHDQIMSCSTVIAYGEGIKQTIVRSMVSVMNQMLRPRFPVKVFGETDAACWWLAEHLGPGWTPGGLAQLIEQVRQAQAQPEQQTVAPTA